MSDYWVNFAKTGNPNGIGLPEWKSYDKETGNIMELGDKVFLQSETFKKAFDLLETLKWVFKIQKKPRLKQQAVWNKVYC